MKKIRTSLIHWLGGYTKEEYNSQEYRSYNKGRDECIFTIYNYAKSLYGLNAEDWCKKMYIILENTYTHYLLNNYD